MALTLDSLKPILPKYDYKYTERPKAACSTYLSDRNPFNLPLASEYQIEEVPGRFSNDGQLTTIKQATDWRGKSRGLFFHHPQGNVNVICVKLSEDCKSPVPVICRERTKTRCTQTRYRESSAQTRPYLPEIANDKENYENYEIYQISKLLDNYEPPGEYEAKVVERARRRRQYEKTLKLLNKNNEKHQSVVEALEWEDWVAREEYIQGCQMLRMKIVEKMFASRENNLRQKSEQRITYSSERIQAKRNAQLRKINIEYDRGMRRLEAKKLKINRCYRKGNIIQEHIDRASDLHAPQMRFGVNPNRRHFVGFRKHFDDRIDELDKQRDVDHGRLSSLACPFSKLKTWAKPKERMKEVTQRFCSDENLKKMYDSLKGLRINSEAPKRNPKCLRKKTKPIRPTETFHVEEFMEEQIPVTTLVQPLDEAIEDEIEVEEKLHEEAKVHHNQQEPHEDIFKSEEEIASIVGEFEGTTLGKLLQFLGDELERLKLQKKFQAIHLLAKKERWWREAAEAGLRQKENKQREKQEKLFAIAYETRQDTSSLFLESVLEREFNFTAESLSRQKITELAEEIPEIDQEERDLEIMLSKGIDRQAYDHMIVGDYVRNKVFAVAEERFAKMKVEKLHEAHLRAIEEELYASVEKALANEFQTPEAICIVGEVLDELIDNAVSYDFDIFTPSSSESEFNTQQEVDDIISKLMGLATQKPGEDGNFFDSTDVNRKLTAEKEAKALIRKLIRKTIPQERWKAEGERIVEQTLSDTFNEAILEIECLKASQQVRADDRLKEVISEIYHRMAECWGKNIEGKSEVGGSSSRSEISGTLRSVPSNIDIFEKSSQYSVRSIESPGDFDDDDEDENQMMRKFEYVDREKLEKFSEPVELHRCRERFNLLDKDAQAHDTLQSLMTSQMSEEENESSERPRTSSEENVSFLSSHYTDLTAPKAFSEPFPKAIYPDLPGGGGEDVYSEGVNLMAGMSYERASACFERASTFQEKPRCSCNRSREDERRSSY